MTNRRKVRLNFRIFSMEYWFSFRELMILDMPAIVILAKTSQGLIAKEGT
jgi:hypothetical protein